MIALTRPFIALCFLKIGPQDLPASVVLLVIALIAHTITEALGASVIMPDHSAIMAGLCATAVLATLTCAILLLQNRRARVLQTLCALAGAIAVIDIIGIPLASWLQYAEATGADKSLPILGLLALTVWSLAVHGHVFRHALSIPLSFGLVVALVFFWVSFQVMHYLFPTAAG